MLKRKLTQAELTEIERHIDEIDLALEILDPSNSIEAQQIESKRSLLRSYISILESDQKAHLSLVN